MLQVKSTTNNTGISVFGNYDDLNSLYNAISSVIGDEGEYFFEAASRRRLLGVCHETRLAYQGKRKIVNSDHDIPCYVFRVLWPEAAFAAAVLDNFILLANAKKLYINRLPHELKNSFQTISSSHIALIHYFQELVWGELERIVGEWQVREIFGEYNELRRMHFKFPQLDGFHTQWLDLLNTHYLFSAAGNRETCLVSTLKKLFLVHEEYLALKSSIDDFAEQEGVRVTGVSFADCFYPDEIEW